MERTNTHSANRDGLLLRSESRSAATPSPDFVLQWGNSKRLRCMKFHASGSGPGQRATSRVDRRPVRPDLRDQNSTLNNCSAAKTNGGGNGYLNLRQRPASPSRRNLRNSDGMNSVHKSGPRGFASPDKGDRKNGTSGNSNSTQHQIKNNVGYHNDQQQHGGSEGGDTAAAVWPPKFAITLTNKEKEEDFLAIKGSKLPQRPKKRAKFIQRTLNLVSPGGWLCDLTLERYEVREKKVSKKRPRGLKAMGNMESESE